MVFFGMNLFSRLMEKQYLVLLRIGIIGEPVCKFIEFHFLILKKKFYGNLDLQYVLSILNGIQ